MAARTLAGSPSLHLRHSSSSVTKEGLWDKITKHDATNEMMFLLTPGSSDTQVNSCGLVQNHAYTVLSGVTLSNGVRLVQVRNPWGSERYMCDWSDSSPKWTLQLKNEVMEKTDNYEGRINDGIFFMQLEDYYAQGMATQISFDTDGWTQDYFLMLDDQTTNSAGAWNWCGAECTRHVLTVTSDVAQDVFVTANTWDQRSAPSECNRSSSRIHSLYMQNDNQV